MRSSSCYIIYGYSTSGFLVKFSRELVVFYLSVEAIPGGVKVYMEFQDEVSKETFESLLDLSDTFYVKLEVNDEDEE